MMSVIAFSELGKFKTIYPFEMILYSPTRSKYV